ncbi:hypothetical protein [Rhodococcus sp. IEGM 1379]|uniref:hypothetical protein n=1 Tax=Rhodococcus sp. IEGM 1379 TaxID=3047086 RepID=UPI0024B6A8E6|nr:hypothetical protein [Rhodococcus sp. IEGM 1379]MDI9914359.1 hypothetical protein [Rhodococcus sp. IEGM 1379]
MAVTAKLFGLALQSAFNKEIDWDTDTIKVMLCTSAYTPDQDTHRYKSSVTNEVSGTGYTAGGATLASASVAYTAGTNTLVLDAADSTWSTSTITARYAVIYNSSPGTDATRPLIAYVDFGADVSTTAGTFTITWDAAGICTLTAA